MAGWIPMPADGWAETAALLTASGKPWPKSAAVFDLRWHADQKVGVPGRGGLMERWGWTDREVRKLLSAPQVWWDSAKGPAPTDRAGLDGYIGASVPGVRRSPVPARTQLGPSSVLPVSQPVPTSERLEADSSADMSKLDPSSTPARPQLGPSSVHRATDGGSQPQPPTQPPAHEQGASPLDPVHLGADPGPCQICGHIVAAGCRHGITGSLFDQRPSEAVQTSPATTDLALVPPKASRAKPAPAKGIANPEVARVWEAYRKHRPTIGPTPSDAWKVPAAVEKVGAKALILIIDWAFLSQESRPHFLRESKSIGQTLFRPAHLDEYRTLAAEWDAGGRRARRSMTSAEAKADANRRALEYVNSPSLNTIDEHGNVVDDLPF